MFPNLTNDKILDGFLTPLPNFKGSLTYIYNEINNLRPELLNCIKYITLGGRRGNGIFREDLDRDFKMNTQALYLHQTWSDPV